MPRRITNFIINPLLRISWRTVVQLWKPMAGWTLLVYAVFTALLVPVLVLLADWGFFRGDLRIVGNEELISWVISPAGFSYLFVIMLITLTGVVIRYAGLFQIVTDDLLGRKISVRATALHILPRILILVKLCIITIFGAVILLLPLLAGLRLIYNIYLAEFDINYYWLATPPEWYSALTWGGIWTFLWFIFAVLTAACLLPAIPAYLDGKKSVPQALRDVWDAPMTQTLKLIKTVAVTALIWILFRVISDSTLAFIFFHLAGWIHTNTESLRLIALVAGNYLLLTIFFSTIISFFGFSMISVIITRFYYSHTRPTVEQEVPGLMKLTWKTIRIFAWWTKPVRAFSLIAVILAGSIIAGLLLADTDPDDRQILNIAHRANALGAPENSIAALENSIAIGADMVEIDVQMTADGTVVLLHDVDLMRVAGDPRRIREVNYPDVNELLLVTGRQLPDSLIRIPTLEQFMEVAEGRIRLLIELKYYGFYPELAEEVIRLIRERGAEEEVLLMSLSTRAVEQVREIAPDLAMGYTSAVAAGEIARLPVHFFAVHHQNITSQLIRDTSQLGQPVYAWTVNRSADMVDTMQKGAAGLITDEPVLARETITEFTQLTRAERLLLQFGLFAVDVEGAGNR